MLKIPLDVVLDKDVPVEARAEIEKAAENLEQFHPLRPAGYLLPCQIEDIRAADSMMFT